MRKLYCSFLVVLSLLILWINVGLHSSDLTRTEKKEDILRQLNFLEEELKHNDLGTRMQELYPEGFVFVTALYGLAWCELSLADTSDSDLRKRAVQEADFAYRALNSSAAKEPFPKYQVPEYGIFYVGWKNYLLCKLLQVSATFQSRNAYLEIYDDECWKIKNALMEQLGPYPSSYPGQSWPADMFVAMASVGNYKNVFPHDRSMWDHEVGVWLGRVKAKLDTATGMIPHKTTVTVGNTVQGSQGSSMALMLRVMSEIDTTFGLQQYGLFKKNFVSTTFGLPSIREYPAGTFGWGDVDSGPVIFGTGFSATLASLGTMSKYDPDHFGDKLYKTINAFGFPTTSGEQKKYLFGMLPMADAFIAWGRASSMNTTPPPSGSLWPLKFHLWTVLVLGILWSLFFRKKILKKIRTVTT